MKQVMVCQLNLLHYGKLSDIFPMAKSFSFKCLGKPLLLSLIFCNILFLQCLSLIKKPVTLRRVDSKFHLTLRTRKSCLSETANGDNIPVLSLNGGKRLKVLCLHGYLSSSKYFRLQLRRLVDEASDISDFGNQQMSAMLTANATATALHCLRLSQIVTTTLFCPSFFGWATSIWTSKTTSTERNSTISRFSLQ